MSARDYYDATRARPAVTGWCFEGRPLEDHLMCFKVIDGKPCGCTKQGCPCAHANLPAVGVVPSVVPVLADVEPVTSAVGTITEPGIYYDLSDERYHADPIKGGSLSSTFARLLTEHVPAKAIARRENRKPTKAMNLGKAAHSHAMGAGPELVTWEHDGRTKEGKAERAAWSFLLDSQAAVAVTPAERDQIARMAEALRSNPEVWELFEGSIAEVSAFWREGPIWARARFDLLSDERAHDYKTCVDASQRGFSKAMARYGYHQQGEFYQRALKALKHPAAANRIRFICQEIEPPYLVQIHEPDDDAMEIAAELNDRAIDIYAKATKSGHWPGPERLVNEPTSLPPFYFYDHGDVLDLPEEMVI